MKCLASLVIFMILFNITQGSSSVPDKVCYGTNDGLEVPANKENRLRELRERYTNCTYVIGNLEITWLKKSDFDHSFLRHIREVTGYVLINNVEVFTLALPRLQIIRGKQLFNQLFALFVITTRLDQLKLPALREINGSVGFYDNKFLCKMETIKWHEMMSEKAYKFTFVNKLADSLEYCGSNCHFACNRGCWGSQLNDCLFDKIGCASECLSNRCFGTHKHECCHSNCAVGCTGPTASDCLACKYSKDNGTCVSACPASKHDYLGNCVSSYQPAVQVENSTCVSNITYTCPKVCKAPEGVVNSNNIDSFKDCTIIEGSISITYTTFLGYQSVYSNSTVGPKIKSMHPDKLEVFSSVKEITGYLTVDYASHPDFKNLSYFRNLEIIGGSSSVHRPDSLLIAASSLISLGLRSLKKIAKGSVAIIQNENLCYVSTIDWSKMMPPGFPAVHLSNNKYEYECKKLNLTCDEECSTQGCWGPGPDQCVSCKNMIVDNKCAKNCNGTRVYKIDDLMCKTCPEQDHYFEADITRCSQCDSQCQGCYGPGPHSCIKCKHSKLFLNYSENKNQTATFICVDKCPIVPKLIKHLLKDLCVDESISDKVDVSPE